MIAMALPRDRRMRFATLSRKAGFLIGAAALVPYVYFAVHNRDGIARVAAVSFGTISAVGAICWSYRIKTAFWVLMAVLALFHLALGLLVPWADTRMPGAVMAPAILIDFLMCLSLAYWVLNRYRTVPSQESFEKGKADD